MTSKDKVARSCGPAESFWPISGERKSPRNTKVGMKVAHATDNNVIIDSPCVSQFYLLKLESDGNEICCTSQWENEINRV